jgi:hypothetical protein
LNTQGRFFLKVACLRCDVTSGSFGLLHEAALNIPKHKHRDLLISVDSIHTKTFSILHVGNRYVNINITGSLNVSSETAFELCQIHGVATQF